MLKKGFIAFFLVLLITACGQGAGLNQDNNVNNTDVSASEKNALPDADDNNHTESDVENNAKKNDSHNEMSDNTSEQANNETDENSETTKNTSDSLSELQVHYMDVGQADATLFHFDGHTILYDTGDWNRNDVINYLDAQGVENIDLVVISHPHADHIGQLEEVMHTYNVDEVWFNGVEASSNTFQGAMTAVLESDADFEEPKTGDETEIGEMAINVLHPATISGYDDLNRDSLSLRFTYGDIEFVFTGDAYKEDEKTMMSNVTTVEADILQLGHHGSDTSSDPAFIESVDPDVAIYSAGADNSYGHPSPETVSLIQDAGISLYGTDAHGTIIITTDGQTYDIETKKDGTITPRSTGASESSDQNKDDSSSGSTPPDGSCVNINDASMEELQAIIHIGPARAEDVVEARPFESVSDLTKVKGIGPARIDDIEEEGIACTGE